MSLEWADYLGTDGGYYVFGDVDDLTTMPGITQADLTKIVEQITEPVAQDILTQAKKTVIMYTYKYVLDEDTAKRLYNDIAIYKLYEATRAPVAEKRVKAYDNAMRELREIRDGKFAGIIPLRETTAPNTMVQGGFSGSGRKLNMAYSPMSQQE